MAPSSPAKRVIPRGLKIAWTAFLAVLVPVYWIHYGPANFLWFSDIALFLIAGALWLESRLLASLAAMSVLPLEIIWNLEFVARLLGADPPLSLTVYMWDESRALGVRLLSLFHVPMPPLMIWLVWRLGYDRRALLIQTLIAWIVLPPSYLLARPENNINWTLGFGTQHPQRWLPPPAWVGMLMLAFPILIYAPMHALLTWMFRPRRTESSPKRAIEPPGPHDRP
jgi:hypothetical protein